MLNFIYSYIIWNPNPQVIPGLDIPRWYSLLFAGGFVISYFIVSHFFRKEGKHVSDVDRLTMYMVLGTVIGARLGHVIFYEPDRYLSNPIDILKTWEGGLASHGAAVGILLALWLYARNTPGQSFLWIVDRIVIVVALTGCLIRIGNLMNSEIGGKPAESNTGFVFTKTAENIFTRRMDAVEKVKARAGKGAEYAPGVVPIELVFDFKRGTYTEEQLGQYVENQVGTLLQTNAYIQEDLFQPQDQPLRYDLVNTAGGYQAIVHTFGVVRHPSQIYESAAYLAIFFLLYGIWNRLKRNSPEGLLFGIFMIVLWSSRFMLEFLKENQVEFEDTLQFNMGQILSIPLILSGFVLIAIAMRNKRKLEEKKA